MSPARRLHSCEPARSPSRPCRKRWARRWSRRQWRCSVETGRARAPARMEAAMMDELRRTDPEIAHAIAQDTERQRYHGSLVNFSGQLYRIIPYGVDERTERIDYDVMARLAKEHRPKIIVSGATAYPRTFDFPRLRAICDDVGALMMVDMAHFAGLVAGKAHPDPVPYADVVT